MKQQRVLMFYPHTPYPARSGTQRRCLDMIDAFLALGYEVTLFSQMLYGDYWWDDDSLQYFTSKGVRVEPYCHTDTDREEIGRVRQYDPSILNDDAWVPSAMISRFRSLNHEINPQIIFVSYVYYAKLIDNLDNYDCLTLIDTIDLVTVSNKLQTIIVPALGNSPHDCQVVNPSILSEHFLDVCAFEADPGEFLLYDRFDCTIAISQLEADQIRAHTAKTLVEFLPVCITPVFVDNRYDDNPVIVAADNPFNIQGYLFFCQQVLPKIRRLNGAFELNVVGGVCSKVVSVDGINLLGRVDDLADIYEKAMFAVCPVLSGTGMSVKVAEAMAYGVPVVAMKSVTQEIVITHGLNGFIANDANEFAHYCVLLAENFDVRSRMGTAARETISGLYSPQKLQARLSSMIERVKLLKSDSQPENRAITQATSRQVAIGIDARTFDYPESLARGVGHYSLYFIYHAARLLPQVRFLLYSERGVLPYEASPLIDLPNVTVDRVDAYDPALVDLVHICDPMNDSSGFDSPLRIFRHDRTTVTFYDTNPIRFYFKEWKQLYIDTYLRRLFMLVNSSCHLLAISEYTRRDLIDYSGIEEQRVTTVMAGFNKPFSDHLNTEAFTMIKQRYGISKPYFLHVGALDTHKNFTIALAAFIDCRTHHDIQLVVVGKTNETMNFVRRTIEERAIPDVVFTGFVPAEELAALYRGAAGTLFLSSCEGFGFPVLEAFANSCPVITSNVTSIPEVAGDAAILCDPLNVLQVVAAMERLLTDLCFADQLRHRGEKRAKVLTWERVAGRAVAVWEEMLGISIGKDIFSHNPQSSIEAEQAISGTLSQAALTNQLSISWQGALFANHSLAHVNRELCLQLLASGYCISFATSEPDDFSFSIDPRFGRLEAIRNLPCAVVDTTIRHQWPPDFTPSPVGHFILIQPWEFGSLPTSWIEPMNTVVDEVWVPSSFVRDCYLQSGITPDRVQVVPNGVNTRLFSPDATPLSLATRKTFRLLFVGGTIQRKGIDILLGAYRQAFTAYDDVCLVIKDMGGGSFYHGQTAQEMIERFQSDPQAPEIEYIDKVLSTAEMAGLYTACHCLVHPYRGEGFGLPIAEAMACGLAPIVTGYGAALDFCPPEIAWLVPATIEKLTIKKVGQLETVDYPWLAEPDFDSLVAMLRHAAQNSEEVRRRGEAAANFIRENYTWGHAARIAEERLLAVAKRPIRRLTVTSVQHIEQRPSGEQSHILVAACGQAEQLAQSGKVDQAVQLLLNQGIRVDAADPRPYVTLAELLIREGRFQDALEVLPEMPSAVEPALKQELAAICHCGLGDDHAAGQAAHLADGRPRALTVLGTLAARQGDTVEAERLFRQAVAADPSCGSGWLSLGMLLWGQGQQEEAWQAVKQAVMVDPLNQQAVQILRDMAERLG